MANSSPVDLTLGNRVAYLTCAKPKLLTTSRQTNGVGLARLQQNALATTKLTYVVTLEFTFIFLVQFPLCTESPLRHIYFRSHCLTSLGVFAR